MFSRVRGFHTGCDDPLGPEDLAGTFVMTSTAQAVQFNGYSSRTLADSFFIGADGFGTRRTIIDQRPLAGGPATIIIQRTDFSFRVEGAAVRFSWLPSCPPNASCTAGRDWYDLGVDGRTMRARDATRASYARISTQAP